MRWIAELDGATAMPCAGRCDEPIPVLEADAYLLGVAGEGLKEAATPLPPENPGGSRSAASLRSASLDAPPSRVTGTPGATAA